MRTAAFLCLLTALSLGSLAPSLRAVPPAAPSASPTPDAAAAAPAKLPAAATTARPAPKSTELSVVRVNSTNQTYDFFRPWSKKNPVARHGLGAVLAGNRVLVTAELVANHSYIELERAESGEKIDAKVVCVDYEANLALLQPTKTEFLDGLTPLELALDAAVGDRVNVLQLESNDALVVTPGPITTVEVARYQLENTAFLIYRLSLALQYREGSFTAPVIREGKLVGMLMRYDPRTQSVDVLPAPVIDHFLKDVDSGEYQGFPRIGLEYAPTRDPQLRHYAKMFNGSGGVYVTDIAKDSPADRAGIKVGDVISSINGLSIDRDGNYDEPLYGRISLAHLITTKSFADQKLSVEISRAGQPQTVEVVLRHKAAKDYVSEPYVIDEPPRYFVAGGLIFQELSRQYLKEWGNDWQKQAPQRLVYLDRYQAELEKDGQGSGSGAGSGRKRVVILSQVLAAASNTGYEDLNYLVVTGVNGMPLKSLDDLPAALSKPSDGFHKIEFEDSPRTIYLDASTMAEDNKGIQESYGLPTLERLK
jgi:S1-C subfamily serine protease